MSMISELKRRNVIRVALAYGAGAWVLVGGMDILTGLIDSPPWLMKFIVGAAVIGFLPVLIFSWVYEMTPEGLRKESELAVDAPRSSHRLNIAILVVLMLAVGLALFERFQRVETPAATPQSGRTATREGPPMVAVLPFGKAGQDSEFFSNGIHDDLLTQLAQLQSIRVISRTSVLEYKDVARNIRQIGLELGADAILEGSVQSSGERIRINAQLIDAHTDEHLWAETYDRELSPANIFEVQTEIAGAITTALEKTLSVQDVEQLSVVPTENMAAYRAFHRALDIRASGYRYLTRGYFQALEQAVTLDPEFTRAWVELVGYHSYNAFGDPSNSEPVSQAEWTLEKVRSLAPGSADHLSAQAYYAYYVVRDYDLALSLVSQALELRPSDVYFLELKSWIQRRQGDFAGRSDSLNKARDLDPRNPLWTDQLLFNLFAMHAYDEASELIRQATFRTYDVAYFQTLLNLRQHQDLARWNQEVHEVHAQFEGDLNSRFHWERLIASGDYDAAIKVVKEYLETREAEAGGTADLDPDLLIWETRYLMTRWFQNSRTLPTEQAAQLADLIREHGSPFDYGSGIHYLAMAVLYTLNGDFEPARQLVSRWQRNALEVGTEFAYSLHESCRVLGMIGDATAAAGCIRLGLEQPSFVAPFLEPYLPHYDSVREHPDFVALTRELTL